ncbi:MAG: GTP-binding protein [Candidatus Heimdallarchaeota archaeon]|nr:GTP-binding protein [Candidatus Heimdallarchaeota archaeon]
MSSTVDDQIREIEEQISQTSKNKSTEHHIGTLKAKIAKLRRRKLEIQFSSSSSKGYGFDIRKTGDGTVVLIGFPSTGKSTLISSITSKQSKVGAYDFTTTSAIPGIMFHRGTQIQIVDLPGIIEDASIGKGRGKEILAVARGSDMILVLLEPEKAEQYYEKVINELKKVAIRPGMVEPIIKIKKENRGGIALSTLRRLTHMTEKTFKGILREYKVINASVTVRSDPTMDQLIDVLEGNRVYPKILVVINKIDLIKKKQKEALLEQFPDAVFISALTGENTNLLKDRIVEKLELIKIFLKKQGEKTDYEEPLIVKYSSTIKDICDKIHRKFASEFRYAVVYGSSAKHDNQRVGLDHIVRDGDVVTIIMNKYQF